MLLSEGIQEALGLDILVHGEAERTDMVEYFAHQMEGMLFTTNGWVQSFGSRCARPPIIWADVHRPIPMTIREFTFAQSLTEKPVKGMLTVSLGRRDGRRGWFSNLTANVNCRARCRPSFTLPGSRNYLELVIPSC